MQRAVIYGNEMVSAKNAFLAGLSAMIVTTIVMVVYMVPIGLLVG